MSVLEQYSLTLPNTWEQVWDETYTVDEVLPGRFTPLPNIEIPILLQERVLVVAVSSSSALPHWTYAGRLIQQHLIPDIGPNPIDGTNIVMRLQSINLQLMSDLTADYRLLYTVPKWIKDISLAIWRFTGPMTSPITNQIAAAQAVIQQNQEKIDAARAFAQTTATTEAIAHNQAQNTLDQIQADVSVIKANTTSN